MDLFKADILSLVNADKQPLQVTYEKISNRIDRPIITLPSNWALGYKEAMEILIHTCNEFVGGLPPTERVTELGLGCSGKVNIYDTISGAAGNRFSQREDDLAFKRNLSLEERADEIAIKFVHAFQKITMNRQSLEKRVETLLSQPETAQQAAEQLQAEKAKASVEAGKKALEQSKNDAERQKWLDGDDLHP